MTLIRQIPIGILALIGLMLATRFHHFGTELHLPDASLAVFFLSGLFFKPLRHFVILLIGAVAIDYVAVTQMNVSDYCVSTAYLALLPTYWLLWASGRYCAKLNLSDSSQALLGFAILFAAASMAFALSNASFYWFSGKFADMSWLDYTAKTAQYYSPYLTAALAYVVSLVASVKLYRYANTIIRAYGHKTA